MAASRSHRHSDSQTILTRTAQPPQLPDNLWHQSAPEPVRRAYAAGETDEGWAAWRRLLATRVRPIPIWELLPGRTAPWLWAVPEEAADSPVLQRLAELLKPRGNGRPATTDIETLLQSRLEQSNEQGLCAAMEAVAWAYALPRLADVVSQGLWWSLWQRLMAIAQKVDVTIETDPLDHQLRTGELPLALAYLFPEVTACRTLAAGACLAISQGLEQLLDGEGLLHASHWPNLRPLLACWTRCRALVNHLPDASWSEEAETQYEWLVRQSLRFARPDGSQMLGSGPSAVWREEMFQAALRLGGDHEDGRLAALVLPKLPANGRKKSSAQSERRHPPASLHSEWAGMTLLRSGWKRSDSWLAVAYPGTEVALELCVGRSVLWSGRWELELTVDGRPLSPSSEWEEVCWVSEEDCDYLELQAELPGGLTVQRQLLLAKQDQFLLLADALLGRSPGEIQYRSRLPLAPGVAMEAAKETRECWLSQGGRRRALAMPLALPEWRADPRPGELRQEQGAMELAQSGCGRCLFAPLFFDLKPSRFAKPYTWRQLTVGQNLQIQPPDVAAGYRVMVDRSQWLIYRALASKANSTVLGHNLATEMLVAQFRRNGEVESILEIE